LINNTISSFLREYISVYSHPNGTAKIIIWNSKNHKHETTIAIS